MKSPRSIFFFWTLLILPTMAIAAAAFTLLRHEAERIEQAEISALVDRTAAVSESLHFTLHRLQNELTRSLLEIPHDQLDALLPKWRDTNPLIRNVFIWHEKKGLLLPNRSWATREERRFISRYDVFFSGQVPWHHAAVSPAPWDGNPAHPPIVQKRPQGADLMELAAQTSVTPSLEKQTPSGWLPWFSENRLFILGWVEKRTLHDPLHNGMPHRPMIVQRKTPHDLEPMQLMDPTRSKSNIHVDEGQSSGDPHPGIVVCGVELELMTLLSRLIPQIPPWESHHAAYAILNGQEETYYQSGPFAILPEMTPHESHPVSPLLPHWRIALFIQKEAMEGQGAFMLISGLLLGIFIVSILSGGALITWQATWHRREAMQKTSFVASVSHELKTPLTSIRLYAELLQSGRVTSKEKTKRYYDILVSESQRLTRLVDNILDFGRLEQGRKTYHLSDFELRSFLENLIQSHNIRLREAGMTPTLRSPDHPMPIRSDPDAIEQILLNILDNAIKYAHQGKTLHLVLSVAPTGTPTDTGNTIDINENNINQHGRSPTTPEHENNISIFTVNNDPKNQIRYTIEIRDNGPGIPKSHQKKIFDKFHRVDASLTAKQPGSGLGLSIARQMARDLGGDLTLKSTDTGYCATIILTGDDNYPDR